MKRMYAVVRDDLVRPQKAVQAGHAISEFLLKNSDHGWKNGTLIYLAVPNLKSLSLFCEKLEKEGVKFSKFIEPDIGDQLTAIAAVSDGLPFRELRLLK